MDTPPLKDPPQLLFLEVETPSAKKECLGILTARYYLAGWRLLFCVENEAAAAYLDQLLWSYPPEAMLPHITSQKACRERVAITTRTDANLNNADLIFNLHTETIQPQAPCRLLVELWDSSSAPRLERSRLHIEHYQQQGHIVQRLPWSQAA